MLRCRILETVASIYTTSSLSRSYDMKEKACPDRNTLVRTLRGTKRKRSNRNSTFYLVLVSFASRRLSAFLAVSYAVHGDWYLSVPSWKEYLPSDSRTSLLSKSRSTFSSTRLIACLCPSSSLSLSLVSSDCG